MKRFRLLGALLLVVMLFARQHVQPVYAAGYVVNSLADNTTNDTFCTLREAILAANNAPANANCGVGSASNDTITFSVSGTITLVWFLPNIVSGAGTLTIDGGGNITISGNNAVRVMIVDSGANLTLLNLTIANASTPLSGGGVVNSGTLTVSNSTFSGNTAGSGGGIVNFSSGTITIADSTFSGNSATFGGGIDNAGGALTVVNSTFSGNSAANSGGGIYNNPDSTLTVNTSTFSSNSATYGGGIANNGALTVNTTTFYLNVANTNGQGGGIRNLGTSTVTNSTFANNRAEGLLGEGGGIWSSGTLTVNHSTFSSNVSNPNNGGGNVRISSGSATIRNTILANSVNGGDCEGTLTSTSTNNLISAFAGCGLTNGVNGNIVGQDPQLGTLTGSPAYFPLTAGSPAFNAGDNATCAATDQRGVLRPQGGRCDIGAFELSIVLVPLVTR